MAPIGTDAHVAASAVRGISSLDQQSKCQMGCRYRADRWSRTVGCGYGRFFTVVAAELQPAAGDLISSRTKIGIGRGQWGPRGRSARRSGSTAPHWPFSGFRGQTVMVASTCMPAPTSMDHLSCCSDADLRLLKPDSRQVALWLSTCVESERSRQRSSSVLTSLSSLRTSWMGSAPSGRRIGGCLASTSRHMAKPNLTDRCVEHHGAELCSSRFTARRLRNPQLRSI